jgi:ATP-dependent helicase/nuclease subunit A
MSNGQQRLDFDAVDQPSSRDEQARRIAVDPLRNIALEASAGTGKTRVLVDRYVGLLAAGVEPRHILAITFTRKAAAEMRQRILDELARRFAAGAFTRERWRAIRDRRGEIAISTIDAFCLALLREFPLEADVDPGFELADETETPRLVDLALDRALRAGRGLAVDDASIALLFADLGEYRLREGLARLIDRRLVARRALATFVRGPRVDVDETVTRFVSGLRAAMTSAGGADAFIASGPDDDEFRAVARDLRRLVSSDPLTPAEFQARLGRVRDYLLTQKGEPRKRLEFKKVLFRSNADYDRHKAAVFALGPHMAALLERYRHDINLVLARAVDRLFAIALDAYRDTMQKQNVLDFSEVLSRTLQLLRQMDEFSRSRFRLESRYQHVLVDEFQDTSRAQWELVELLIRSWGEGESATAGPFPPSIFIVGDRKQSIYGFRDAEVEVLEGAARYIQALRPMGQVRHAITRSFRSVRELLSFVNDAFTLVEKQPERSDAFRYGEDDAFPLAGVEATEEAAIGLALTASDGAQAEAVAEEVARLLLEQAVVRDRQTGVRRAIRPGDIAILFRTRESHRLFEDALRRRRVPFYVYKGLGFFDADEIKDVLALMAYLAAPDSNLRAAAFLRSRFVRLSDAALTRLAPGLAAALTEPDILAPHKGVPYMDGEGVPNEDGADAKVASPSYVGHPFRGAKILADDDRVRLDLARASVRRWLLLVDRLPPAELVDRVLAESAYMAEIAGEGEQQARENLKKIRGLLRRMQNRGYATLSRVVDHFSRLTAGGDESNAIVDAEDAVSLMTVHAAKGLEFPVVVVANIARGSGGTPDAIRVTAAPFREGEEGEPAVAIGEHQSAADLDAEASEAEESKRLLYVACTRARDRLYIAATLDRAGRFAPVKGSLGRVLSPELTQFMTMAASDATSDALPWAGPSAVHRVRLIRPPVAAPRVLPATLVERTSVDDLEPLGPPAVTRMRATSYVPLGTAATDVEPSSDVSPDRGPRDGERSSQLAGVLIHRALEARIGLGVESRIDLPARLASLLRDEERSEPDVADALERARQLYGRVLARDDLRALFGSGLVAHEVDFSLRHTDGTIVRGAIDCLVQDPGSGRITVVEIKSGAPSSSHDEQLARYVAAARALFPGTGVAGRLIYL